MIRAGQGWIQVQLLHDQYETIQHGGHYRIDAGQFPTERLRVEAGLSVLTLHNARILDMIACSRLALAPLQVVMCASGVPTAVWEAANRVDTTTRRDTPADLVEGEIACVLCGGPVVSFHSVVPLHLQGAVLAVVEQLQLPGHGCG